jgi:hypothetical protein
MLPVAHYRQLDPEPHYKRPAVARAYLLICYRNFAAHDPNYSHVGLGINALNTAKVLREHQVQVDIAPVWTADDLSKAVVQRPGLTHVLVEAPFIAASDFAVISNRHTNVQFCCRSHSQIGFLVVEPGAISTFRDYLRLQDSTINFRAAVNSPRLGGFVEQAYRCSTLLLTNLYYLDRASRRPYHPPAKTLRIGSFGCLRLMKNHITAAAAALIMAATSNKDLEFYISVNREEHGKSVLQSLRNTFAGVPYARLIEVPWQSYAQFRHQVALLDLHIQVSMTETFNLVSADAISEGVPALSSDALDWIPARYQVPIDDASEVARVGSWAISDPNAAGVELSYLSRHVELGVALWLRWLSGTPMVATMPDHGLV